MSTPELELYHNEHPREGSELQNLAAPVKALGSMPMYDTGSNNEKHILDSRQTES